MDSLLLEYDNNYKQVSDRLLNNKDTITNNIINNCNTEDLYLFIAIELFDRCILLNKYSNDKKKRYIINIIHDMIKNNYKENDYKTYKYYLPKYIYMFNNRYAQFGKKEFFLEKLYEKKYINKNTYDYFKYCDLKIIFDG